MSALAIIIAVAVMAMLPELLDPNEFWKICRQSDYEEATDVIRRLVRGLPVSVEDRMMAGTTILRAVRGGLKSWWFFGVWNRKNLIQLLNNDGTHSAV